MEITQNISHDFSGLRILLADDNFLSREITKAILEETGFMVDTVENGQEEVEQLCAPKPYRYDLILSDVQMPVMNGHDAARTIRALKNPELASIPIVALSADYYETDIQAALDCGMNAHLAKPLDIHAFTTTLATVLTNCATARY